MNEQPQRGSSAEETVRAVLTRIALEPQRLGAILDERGEPLLAFSRDRMILFANRAAEAFFGYGRGDLAAHSVEVIVPVRFRQPDAPPMAALDDLTTVQIPGLHRDGSEIPIAWTYGYAPGPEGPVFVLLVKNSAEQARREQEMEDRFRAVYENALDGMCLIDDGLRFIDVNPAGCRLLGRAREQVIGVRVGDLIPDPRAPGGLRSIGALAGESALLLPDGSLRRAEFGATADVAPGVHLSIFRDIEDRKRAEEAQHFLDEISIMLASASLDRDLILSSIARLAVHRIADWAGVELLEHDQVLRRLAVAHAGPRKLGSPAVSDGPPGPAAQSPPTRQAAGVGELLRRGAPALLEIASEDALRAALGEVPELLQVMRELGLVSLLQVPLSARGQVIGLLSLLSAESRRRYGPADVLLAHELSRRADQALDNALYVRDLQRANQIKDLFLRRAQHLQATATKLVRAGSVEAIAHAFEADEPPSPVGAHGWALFSRVGDRLRLVAATPGARDSAPAWSPMELSTDNPLAEAARTGAAIWLQNRGQLLERYPQIWPSTVRSDVEARAIIPLPLSTGETSMGALVAIFREPRGFDADEQAYLTGVADLWAQALHRAQLAEAERGAIQRALAAETLATRKKDEFLAMLGHELRNPLAPIVTATSLLRVRGRATHRELEVLDRQARHMVRLVDDLLDISRITSGKLTLKRTRVELADVLAQALESTSPLFEERRIRLFPDMARPPVVVDGDRERLVQVLGNVLVNAAKFTPMGKSVFVSVCVERAQALVSVRDEGKGIEAELLPHIFDLFSQGPQGPDRASGGLGLGLAIAHSIVVAHAGRIEVASRGREQGTTVTIRLPLLAAVSAEQPSPAVASHDDASSASSPRRHRVVIVDDNEDSAAMLAEFLSEMGYECQVAFDGQSGLTAVREVLPDVAILDIGLPDIDGHELARQIRAALDERAPKLIALTGYARDVDRDRALEAGFLEHMAKPVEMATLTAKLSGLLAASTGPLAGPLLPTRTEPSGQAALLSREGPDAGPSQRQP